MALASLLTTCLLSCSLPSAAAELAAAGMEGPELPFASTTVVVETDEGPDSLQLRPRRESDAYVETAVAASSAVVSSVDGGEKDLMAAETMVDLALRASVAGVSTATNVALVRGGSSGTVDLAALWIPEQGAGMTLTLRF